METLQALVNARIQAGVQANKSLVSSTPQVGVPESVPRLAVSGSNIIEKQPLLVEEDVLMIV